MKLFLYVHSATRTGLHSALALAASAATLGEAHLYLSWAALQAWCTDLDLAPMDLPDELARQYEAGVDRGALPSLDALAKAALETGKVRVYACSTSAQILRLTPQQLEGFDAILGHTAFLRMAEEGQLIAL